MDKNWKTGMFLGSNLAQLSSSVAQLLQRDRIAGWISCCQKGTTIFCRQYRSIFNCDIIGLCKAIEFGEVKQNKCYYAIQGYQCQYQSKHRMRLPISDK